MVYVRSEPVPKQALALNRAGSQHRFAGGRSTGGKRMEHKPLVELQTVADLSVEPRTLMSRRERLTRWAELLERDPKRRLIPTRGLADSLGLPKSSRVRIDGGEWEIRHATGAYTSRGLRRRSPARGGSEDEERYPGASPFGTGRDL